MAQEITLNNTMQTAAYYIQRVKDLENDLVTGPGITFDLSDGVLEVEKEE